MFKSKAMSTNLTDKSSYSLISYFITTNRCWLEKSVSLQRKSLRSKVQRKAFEKIQMPADFPPENDKTFISCFAAAKESKLILEHPKFYQWKLSSRESSFVRRWLITVDNDIKPLSPIKRHLCERFSISGTFRFFTN